MKTIYYIYAWLLARPSFCKINKLIYMLALRGMGVYNYTNGKISGELWLINNKIKKIGTNLIVFDVGANIGSYTKDLIKHGVDAKKIFSFEPNGSTYEQLVQNTLIFPQVVTVNAALSDMNGNVKLFDREHGGGSPHASLSSEIFNEIHDVPSSSTEVKVIKLDDFCAQNGIEQIDFLKIDVEGFELNVLRGASSMISCRKIKTIQFEFTQLNAVVGVFFRSIYELLSENYDIYRLLPHGLMEIKKYDPTMCEIFGYQNYVAFQKTSWTAK